MRHLLPGLSAGFLLALALPVAAQAVRVVTWQSDDFPAPLPGTGTNDPDVKRLRQMANALKPYEADVILLEGLADRPVCQRLAGFLKPLNYNVATFHVFRGGGVSNLPVTPSIAILTRKTPLSARSVEWRTSGQVDTPGGFNFVTVPVGSNALSFYASYFVDPPMTQTNVRAAQANALKREFAAQYLMHHTRWLESTLTNPLTAFVLAGNLSTGPAADAALQRMEQGAFRRAAAPASGEAGLMAPKDWLARNAQFAGPPKLGLPRNFSYGPVVCELTFSAPAPIPAGPAVATAALGKPGPRPVSADSGFRKFPVDERFVWLFAPVAGAVLVLLILWLPYRWHVTRRQSRALVVRPRGRVPVVVDFVPSPSSSSLDQSPTVDALPEGVAGGADTWEERDRAAEQRAKAAAVVREGLMPQLVRLMREKIFQRLSSQRAHLLDSHLNGTMAVLELEERLEKIQSQFATRLAAREQRIAELEAELAAKENIIRELIKAQARLAGRVSNE